MRGEWKTVPAKAYCTSIRDGTHNSPKPVDFGKFLVTSRHITSGRLDLSNAYLISQSDFDEINRRSKVDQWDVLISMIGTVGECCLIKESPDFAIKNIGLFKSKGEIEGKWLYYYLTSKYAQQLIREQSRGTTQQYVPLEVLRNFPIQIPSDRSEMQAIAHILGTLDDKIELNRRMNETLEAMARALFKSWFVDFDPVRRNIARHDHHRGEALPSNLNLPESRGNASPRQTPPNTYSSDEIDALFPDGFEDSALGEIPRGWKIGMLSDLLLLQKGYDLPAQARTAGKYPVVAASGISGSHSEFMAHGPGVVTGRSGVLGKVFYIIEDYWPLNTSLYVREFRAATPTYAFFIINGLDFGAFNAGSAVPSLNRNHVHTLPVTIPPHNIVKRFDSIAAPLFVKMHANDRQANTLDSLRDTLLPKLISGDLRVQDAEQFVEKHL